MKHYHFFIFSLLFNFCVNTNIVTSLCASATEWPQVEHTPQKPGLVPYGGAVDETKIKDVRVSPCLSLGGGCIDKINNVLKDADQFIISFMYRFNSPTLIRTLEDKYIKSLSKNNNNSISIIVFLDYNQVYESPFEGSKYYAYVKHLIDSVPISLVKLGNRSFHQKVIISKKTGEEAITILGSANATFEADNMHSEDLVFVQSNKLAAFYLGEFEKLFRSEPQTKLGSTAALEQQVKVFHEHRLREGESNIDYLISLKNRLVNTNKERVNEEWYKGNVVSLAISTGHPEMGGTQKCVDIVSKVLNADNEFLFLFENYISLSEELKKAPIWEALVNNIPKFIVLDDNKTNREEQKNSEISKTLSVDQNKILLFRPFTDKKFHHKLIIQYPSINNPSQLVPAVYTGSFHISTNAIKKNSETIIGIESAELADEYLSSLLLNSGLGDYPEIWRFIQNYPQLLTNKITLFQFQDTKVLQAAKQLLTKCEINIGRYLDRLDRIRTEIVDTASDAKEQDTISGYFKNYINEFKESKDPGSKLSAIEDLTGIIFTKEEVYSVWLEYLKNIRTTIKTTYNDIEKLPSYSPDRDKRGAWLMELCKWLESETREYKEKGFKIKSDMNSIEHLYRALNDIDEYGANFSKYSDLHDILTVITKSID